MVFLKRFSTKVNGMDYDGDPAGSTFQTLGVFVIARLADKADNLKP